MAAALGAAALSTAAGAGPLPCQSVSLKGATGVIGEKHGYTVTGSCLKEWAETTTKPFSSSSTNHSISLDFAGKLSWNRDTGEAKESISFKSGNSETPTGKRVVTGVCTQDPFLKDPPGGAASCHSVQAQAVVESGPTLQLLTEPSFWLAKKIALIEAQSLSQQAASKPTATPPPPAQPPAPKPQVPRLKASQAAGSQQAAIAGVVAALPKPGPIGLEAEGMLAAQKAFAHGGSVAVQSMRGFGNGWSGGAQLFWSGGQVGSWLDLVVDIPAPGTYSMAIYLTKAPDYAQVQVEVDANKALTFDGFSSRVEPSGPVRGGRFELQAGPRRVRLTITGRNAGSSGLLVGVDRVDLIPVQGS
jgi:hypothetical protein